MQPRDIGRLIDIGSPAVSPDGSRIAFAVRRVDLDKDRYRTSVWLADADGATPPRQLTGSEHGDSSPVWSPDGTRLAVVTSTGEGGASLRVLPLDGPGEPVVLCTRDEGISEVAWSPDGARIAFVSRERTARYDQGDDDRSRGPRRIDRLFSRLDGEGWIIDRPSSVFVVDAAGAGTPRIVAGGPFEHSDPAWSPDNRTLVVAAGREKDWDLSETRGLYLVDVDDAGAEPRLLTTTPALYALPSFSLDGDRVAALVADEHLAVPANAHPVVIDVTTGAETRLAGSLDRTCRPFPGARAPVWDGEALLFAAEDGGAVTLHRVGTAAGDQPELLVGGDRVVAGYDRAGGTTALLIGDPTHQPELYVLDDAGEPVRRTGLTDAFHAEVPAPMPERLGVPSPAGDGDIDTWVLLPTGRGDGPFPTLLSIHGGPMAQYGSSWFDEFRLWAGAGYAVVWCNPHGSTGRSESWLQAIRAPEAEVAPGTGWGGIDADDVMAALDGALEAYPQLDRDRVGVLGGSYGGYLTTWLASHHPDRFAAACSERAVNNIESNEWSSDAGGLFHWEFGVTLYEKPERYRAMSPVHDAAAITAPMLILHSEEDLRCPPEQADGLFVALRLLGKPVEYWRFPGESHGLSRGGAPRNRVRRAQIILDFFGRHLGGDRPDEMPAG
ncbi:S9 family peptidase [Pseudonocardia phyllosphaerae]|uniref:S9 family peptidase n=1 Tax=Pseudonocardia phyllosphaerae TaxID=3390502 RepID=UPI0039798302